MFMRLFHKFLTNGPKSLTNVVVMIAVPETINDAIAHYMSGGAKTLMLQQPPPI
jgi:hypothetical protein